MLAEDEITIRIAGETLFIKPTLRAAMRLERAFGGFDKLISAIDGESVTAMAHVLRESATTYTTVPDLIASFDGMTLDKAITSLKQPLIEHVLRLAGHDATDTTPVDPQAKRTSFAVHHARLFALGTGWLGWSPEVTYDATAAEITAAFHGRLDMLKAIFGSTDASEAAPTGEPTPEQFNAKLSAFLSMIPQVAA